MLGGVALPKDGQASRDVQFKTRQRGSGAIRRAIFESLAEHRDIRPLRSP